MLDYDIHVSTKNVKPIGGADVLSVDCWINKVLMVLLISHYTFKVNLRSKSHHLRCYPHSLASSFFVQQSNKFKTNSYQTLKQMLKFSVINPLSHTHILTVGESHLHTLCHTCPSWTLPAGFSCGVRNRQSDLWLQAQRCKCVDIQWGPKVWGCFPFDLSGMWSQAFGTNCMQQPAVFTVWND